MSIFDALIEDDLDRSVLPLVQREVWIAIRTDRPATLSDDKPFGSGTRENPYDGSTAARLDPLLEQLAAERTVQAEAKQQQHYIPGGLLRGRNLGTGLDQQELEDWTEDYAITF